MSPYDVYVYETPQGASSNACGFRTLQEAFDWVEGARKAGQQGLCKYIDTWFHNQYPRRV